MPSTHTVSQNTPPPPPPSSSSSSQRQQQQTSLKVTSMHENEPCSSSHATVESSRCVKSKAWARPCVALSQNIVLLYKLINKKYSEERRRREPGQKYNDGYDDRHGHYLAFIGEEINERYTVLGILGRGSFGTVLNCFDEKYQEQVAVKVIRCGGYFYDQGLMEVSILEELNRYPLLDRLVVRLKKVFLWKEHLVLVFEMLSINLFQLIHRTNYNGVSLNLTRKFAYQMVLILKQLEDHDPPVIHCDIKPENVVLRHPKRSSISLIDFGSACYCCPGAKLHKYVQSRFYRSVEVILELDYNTAIDRWSLGCMLVELHTGVPLFAGRDEVDQLARIIAVLGPLPDDMIERSPKRDFFFHDLRRAPHYQKQQQQQQQQHQPVPSLHHGVGGEGWCSSSTAHGQKLDPYSNANTAGSMATISVSPVIAAEVLQSMSATSSISVVTAASTTAGQDVTAALPTAFTTTTSTTPTIIVTPAEGHQLQRQCVAVPISKVNSHFHGNSLVTSGMRRPLTAVAVPMSKKGKFGFAIVGGGGGGGGGSAALTPNGGAVLTPAAAKTLVQLTSVGKKQRPNTQVNASATNADRHTQVTEWTPSMLPLRAITTPKGRLVASSSHSHSRGVSEAAPISLTRSGRTSTQPKEEQQQQYQPCVAASKSPFILRAPPKPEQCQTLEEIIGVYTCGPRGFRHGEEGHDVESYEHFADFVRKFLLYHPGKRMSCSDALQHPFLLRLETEYRTTYMSGITP